MLIHRLPNKTGCGVITNHTAYLESKGYSIITARLNFMEEPDFRSTIPALQQDGSIKMFESQNSIYAMVKNIHENGGKAALLLDDYENNKHRFPTVTRIVDKGENVFNMNADDVVFFQANDGFEFI